ncbi:MAG: hypothetical protein H6745_32765 [Deltaproteobacteria bacterium]|nr:hypothetical protein [Deltaproteobacteria bacterium]
MLSAARRALLPALLVVAAAVSGCSTFRAFPNQAPMAVDDDRQPFGPKPETYFSPFVWDGADNSVFRPLSNLLAVDPAGAAINVNAVDEVPDSSWFTNRIGLGDGAITPERLAVGPCEGAPPADPAGPWTVTGGKPDGENPGFFIKMQDGSRYLLKFDGAHQAPRATAADVIVTRLYWAAGYFTPCNRVVFFDKSILHLAPDATAERSNGSEEPMTQEMVDAAFERALRLPDGRYRGNASLFIEGAPIGPWRYEGTRDDDANDVVAHEERRELRGASVIASWVNHFDSREQNTLSAWMKVDGDRGYVRHYYIDFGDCFGSLWEWDALSRRWGHSYVFDIGHILGDFFSLGFIVRPWDRAHYGPTGETFGYFQVEPFEPDAWVNEYPNPAFGRRQEADGAWMARILAQITPAHVKAVVKTGELEPAVEEELVRVLLGRRDKILRRWFSELSPLAFPVVKKDGDGAVLCVRDLAVQAGIEPAEARAYDALGWLGLERAETDVSVHVGPTGPCVSLPAAEKAADDAASYVLVDVFAGGRATKRSRLRVHLYQVGRSDYRLVGLERPDSLAD